MSEKREYFIPNTELYAVRIKNQIESRQAIFDCDGDIVSEVPAEWNEHELDIWAKAWESGVETGERWGKDSGEYLTQKTMLEALGIYNRLNEIEANIKLLASTLYWHDGISKADVAAMAGRD